MEKIGNRLKNLVPHLKFWGCYFVMEYMLAWGYSGDVPKPIAAISHFILNGGLLYFLYLFLFPRLSWINMLTSLRSAALIIGAIFIYVCTKFTLGYFLTKFAFEPLPAHQTTLIQDISGALYRAVSFTFPAIGIYNLLRFEKAKAAKSKFIHSQFNKMLRTQASSKLMEHHEPIFLNGHLDYHGLFSTLDFISRKLDQNDLAGKLSLQILVDLLRYPSSGQADLLISLRDEFNQLQSRLELKKVTGRKNLAVSILIPDFDCRIPKNMLMPLFVTLMSACDLTGNILQPRIYAKQDQESVRICFDKFTRGENIDRLEKEIQYIEQYLNKQFSGHVRIKYALHGELIDINLSIDLN